MPLICFKCKGNKCLKTGKPCERVEKILKEVTSYKNNKEITMSPEVLDKRFYRDKDGLHYFKPKKKNVD